MINGPYFPGLDEFYNKFCNAINRSGEEQRFLTKWGLNALSDVYIMLSNNVQGGYESHKHSMLSIPPAGSVLSIGPGIGFCGFLLSELYETVFVAEPDEENCALLKHISDHYITHKNKNAGQSMKILHAGLSITDEAITYWKTKQQLMKKRHLKGSILNFDIYGAAELAGGFQKKVSRIYLHKVLSSFSISGSFENIITACASFLADQGVITWSEPGYIFKDILAPQGGSEETLADIIKPIFEKNQLELDMMDYQVSNRNNGMETSLVEKWTLLNAKKQRRSMNEKR